MDDYGLEASGLDPDTTAELRRLRREQAIVDEMARQGMTPLQGGMVGNVYVRPSITQGLANLANSYFAGERQRKIDEDYKAMGEKRKAVEQAAFKQVADVITGSPEKREPLYFDDQASQGGWTGSEPSAEQVTQARAPGTRQDIMNAMLQSQLPDFRKGAIQMMIKEKLGTPEGFTLSPGQVRYDASGKQLVSAPDKLLQIHPPLRNTSTRKRMDLLDHSLIG